MINLEKAERLFDGKLKEIEKFSGVELAVLKSETIEFEYGWMFFYQSRKFVETGDEGALVGGNAPIIIDKFNSSLHTTGTRLGERFYIENYCKYRDDPSLFKQKIR